MRVCVCARVKEVGNGANRLHADDVIVLGIYILCYTVLYCVILHYIVLYCTILCFV